MTLGALLWASGAHAQELGFASELGAGGGTRASLHSMSAAYFSPATLALEPRYQIAGGIGLGPNSQRTLQGGAMDSTTGPIALGLMYQRVDATPPTQSADLPGWRPTDEGTDNPVQDTTVVGSLATGQPVQGWAVGLGGSWRRHTTRFGGTQQALDAIVSAAVRTGEQLVWSVTATDILPFDDGLAPAQLGAGGTWQPTPSFFMGANLCGAMTDAHPSIGWNAGLDGQIGWVSLRAGASQDPLASQPLGALGLGMSDDQLALDYAVQATMDADLQIWHSLSLRLTL